MVDFEPGGGPFRPSAIGRQELAADASGHQGLIWRTEENGKLVALTSEPNGNLMKGMKSDLLSLLPLDDFL